MNVIKDAIRAKRKIREYEENKNADLLILLAGVVTMCSYVSLMMLIHIK